MRGIFLSKIMEKILKRIIIIFIILVAGIVVVVLIKGVNTFSTVSTGESLFDPNKDKRWDVLILGNRGEKASGGGILTDSIMILSYEKETGKAAIISIPRDLWIDIPGNGSQKINSAYAAGFNGKGDPKEGIKMAKEAISEVIGLDIDFVIVVDVDALKEIVDSVGGITVYEDKWFYENFYGNEVQIRPGENYLDGSEVLGYIGMRKYDSDFARMERQQKVVLALEEKAFSLKMLTRPDKIWNVFNSIKENIRTDLNASQIQYLIKNASKFDVAEVEQVVFDNTNYLYSTQSAGGAYILLPKAGDFSEIQEVAKNIFKEGALTKEKENKEEEITKVGK